MDVYAWRLLLNARARNSDSNHPRERFGGSSSQPCSPGARCGQVGLGLGPASPRAGCGQRKTCREISVSREGKLGWGRDGTACALGHALLLTKHPKCTFSFIAVGKTCREKCLGADCVYREREREKIQNTANQILSFSPNKLFQKKFQTHYIGHTWMCLSAALRYLEVASSPVCISLQILNFVEVQGQCTGSEQGLTEKMQLTGEVNLKFISGLSEVPRSVFGKSQRWAGWD